uniref:Septin-type G domain-containing protein n=1 Tax=Echeneis naucrates TaxID=173247 RepID=A0A665TB93_ECHNA
MLPDCCSLLGLCCSLVVWTVYLSPSQSPALYQLSPQRGHIGTVAKMTVGEKNLSKENKTILLVGETGAGKSSLVNTLLNFAMGVKFEDDIWFEIVERETRSQAESQTSDVIVYEIFDFKENVLSFSLTIIDTPGYGDTRGLELDVMVGQRLFDLFTGHGGVHEINAVGLVMKATENRLSDRLKYIFDSVISLFGKNLGESIVALITYSNGRTPINALQALDAAKIKCARNEKNQPIHFLFDNCQNEGRSRETETALRHSWDLTNRKTKELMLFTDRIRPQKLITTIEVLHTRIKLAACVHNLQDRMRLIEMKQQEIKQIQDALKKHAKEMKKNEKFTVDIDEVYKEKETTRGGIRWLFFSEGALTCMVCQETCHHPCTVARKPKHCKVIEQGHCIVCTNRCPASVHVKENWKYVNKTKKVQKTEEQMKLKYDRNRSEGEKKWSLLENLEKEMIKLTEEKAMWLEEAYGYVVRLDQIALKVDSLSTHVHLDFLTEKMQEKGDKEKIQKLQEMKIRMDKKVPAALRFVYIKIMSAGRGLKDVFYVSGQTGV